MRVTRVELNRLPLMANWAATVLDIVVPIAALVTVGENMFREARRPNAEDAILERNDAA
jgi:hypothetical protein